MMDPQLQKILKSSWGDKPITDEMKDFISKVEEHIKSRENYYNYFTSIIAISKGLAFEIDSYYAIVNAFVSDESLLLKPRELIIGKRIDELFGLSLLEKYKEIVSKVLKQKKSLSFEFISEITQNNFLARISYLENTDSHDPHVFMYVRDISESKNAESKLIESENRFRKMIEAARDIFYTTDKDGNYTYVNEAVFDKIGYKPEELIGLNFTHLIRPDHIRRVKLFYYKQIQQKKAFSYLEFPIEGKNGEKLWIGQNVQLLFKNDEYIGTQAVVRDITNIKISETTLKQSEERFRKLLQNSMDVITVLDESGNIIYDNFSIYTQFGYEKPLIGTSIFKYFHPDDLQQAQREFKKTLSRKGVSEPIEFRFKAADGTWKYVEALGNNLLDEPNIKGIVINSRDITERKKIEQDLKQSEERFRKLVQYSSDITTVVSIDGTITYVSPSFFRLFGYSQELIGKNIFEFLHPDDLQTAISEFQRGIEIGGVSDPIQVRFKSPDGSWKYLETIGNNLINEPSINGIVLNSREITERKRMENALAETSEKLSAIVESTDKSIFAIDREYNYIAFNNAHKSMLKRAYDIDIKIGTSALIHSSEEDKILMKNIFDRCLSGEQFTYVYEAKFLGEDSFHNIAANPIKDNLGNVTGVAIFSENITHEKKVEADLIRTKNEAIQASKVKSEFLSNMSHEIRTPMNAIVSLSDLLLEKNFDSETTECITTINSSVNNLLVVINDILDFSKIEDGKIRLEQINFDLTKILNEIVQIFKHKAESKNLEFTLEIDKDVPKLIKGDPYRLNQILVNLVGNAIKFTANGSVRIIVKSNKLSQQLYSIQFSVEDTGIGIPENKLNTIFERFTQANNEITRTFGGTGLGLAITKKLIEMQKGKVSVESVLHKGSKFTAEIPYKGLTTSIKIDHKTTPAKERNLNGLNILVVEDNKVNQFVVKQIASTWNANITIVNDGIEAIEKVQQKDFDIILMDLQMPIMNGYEATRIIRSLQTKVKDIPIIALTADALTETNEKVFASGMNDFLTKPIDREDLYLKIIKHTRK